MEVGDRFEVVVRGAAHGGAMLAAIPDDEHRRTVFVRHGLPGERGTAQVTALRSKGRLIYADLVDVAEPSADRVVPPCRFSGPGGCGGCDFQHVALPAQRQLKADVVRDCLRRIAGFDPAQVPWDGSVQQVSGDTDGLRWRTRSRFAVRDGSLAMQGRRSSDLIPIDDCLIAVAAVVAAAAGAAARGNGKAVMGVCSSAGDVAAGPPSLLAGRIVHERLGDRVLQVSAAGFWQVHPGAAGALSAAVASVLRPTRNESLLDLYGGVGLFAVALSDALGDGAINVVEGDRRAAQLARQNLGGRPGATVHHSPVVPWLRRFDAPVDLVVLDPPRSGAGPDLLAELHRLRPRSVAYVACDPAAMSRDLRSATDLGWQLTSLTAFDLFPMTHHIECVAGLLPPA